jgi:hypothetical protein
MKSYFIFLCLLISGGLASATTQTSLSQDKPPRLYVKSYSEANNNHYIATYIYPNSTQVYDYKESDGGNWADGSSGSWNGTMVITYMNGYTRNYQISVSSPPLWWPNTYSPQTVYYSTYNGSTSINYGYGLYFITSEHCDTSAPLADNSGTYTLPGLVFVEQNTEARTAQAVVKLQTGGKSTSKLRNLFGLSCSATRYDPAPTFYGGCYEGPSANQMGLCFGVGDVLYGVGPAATGILPANINLGSYGTLNTNGVKYIILPDNADVDVTPYVGGVDYYSFNFGQPQKYNSYFDLYVQQANPGYSLIFYNPTNDVGHAFWRFRTDAPSNALRYISPSVTGFLGQKWGFYPFNGLFTVPGILQNDTNHSFNISRTFHIGFPDLLQGLIYTRGISNAPPVYVLSAFNCVGAARGAGFAADVFGLPWDESPQNFGVTLIEMYPAPGQIIGPFIDTSDVFYSSAPY